jgi:superfamily II DNA or RNA helicase
MHRIDRFIVDCPSFEDFRLRVRALSKKEKGDVTERLAQVYLQTAPEYRTALKKVWLLRQAPASVLTAIGLPRDDKGIDLIAQHRDGTYWVIQAKYRTDEDAALGWEELSTFFGLSSAPRRNISLAVIVHTTARPISNRDLMGDKVVEIGLDRWKEADWSLIRRTIIENAPARPTAFAPRPEWKQDRAIAEAVKHFINHTRGRLLMPCGTGKSLLAFWIAEALKAKSIIVAVPSLSLIKQSVAVWMRELVAKRQTPAWLCVASDDSVGGLDNDEFVDERYDSGLPTTTDANEIAAWLRKLGNHKIIFTTYQSSKQVAGAAKLAAVEVDLIIFDEAHRTVGARDREFATLLHDDAIKARRRLFMTATERKIGGDVDLSFSMDDNEKDYGQRFFTMTFKEAISLGIISDYKIVTYSVTESEVNELVKSNRLLNLGHNLEEAQAQDMAAAITVKRAMKEYGVKHALVFNRSIRAAKDFREVQDVLNYLGIGPYTVNFHVNGEMSAGVRKQMLDEFEETTAFPALMTNARCLTEGVDVPGIDYVMFAAPKQSVIDIVQASGRAMRKAKGKKYGYIVVPIIVPDGKWFDEFAETTTFRKVVSIISALSTQDTRIVEELKAIFCGPTPKARKPRERILKFGGTVPIGFRMSLEQFADAITTQVWETVARVNPRPFEVARAFVQDLYLKSVKEWEAYCISGNRPADIPSNPQRTYTDSWADWGDWLGTGRQGKFSWRPFEEARDFARGLKLNGTEEWWTYCKSSKRPSDIPTAPYLVYAAAGWVDWGDWLGTGRGRIDWRSFEDARAFVRGLKLKNGTEWRAYCLSGKKPSDIPNNPNETYPDVGWTSLSDWLGAGRRMGGWRSFEEARTYVRSLGLKSQKEWEAYCKSGKKPDDIPRTPWRVYADDWVSWADWLGGRHHHRIGGWRPYEDARNYVHGLGIKSQTEWKAYCQSGERPEDIPASPSLVYTDDWVNWADWLGNGKWAEKWASRSWRPFEEARAFVHSLGLKSHKEWRAYRTSGNKPEDIPTHPEMAYADDWVSWSDWLGASLRRIGGWRPFEEARNYVHGLRIKSEAKWRVYRRSGNKPEDIPANPSNVYTSDWVNWPDWLGTTKMKPKN